MHKEQCVKQVYVVAGTHQSENLVKKKTTHT